MLILVIAVERAHSLHVVHYYYTAIGQSQGQRVIRY